MTPNASDYKLDYFSEAERELFRELFCKTCHWNKECDIDHNPSLTDPMGAECEAGSETFRQVRSWFIDEYERKHEDSKKILADLTKALEAASKHCKKEGHQK